MSPAEARRQAVLKFGGAQAIREDHHAEHSIPFIENLLFDLKYAVRMLLRSPGFAHCGDRHNGAGRRNHRRDL